MKTVTIDVSKDGVCMLGDVSGCDPTTAYEVLAEYNTALNPGMRVLGILLHGQDGESQHYWVYSWEELADLALEHEDLVRVRVVGPGAREAPDWLEVAVDAVAEAASAPEMRRGSRDELDIEEGAFARYVLAEMSLGWDRRDIRGGLCAQAAGLTAAAEDLRAGARALQDLAYTHKCWMHAEDASDEEG